MWYQWLHSDHRAAQERGARTSSTISTADAVGMLAAAVAPAAAAEALSGAAVGSAAAPELADAGALVREQAHTVAAAAAAAAVAPAARCSFISSSPEKKCRKCTMAKNHILTYTYILMSIFPFRFCDHDETGAARPIFAAGHWPHCRGGLLAALLLALAGRAGEEEARRRSRKGPSGWLTRTAPKPH